MSETVFVASPSDAGHRADIRIFTPSRELPFAGHPTIGTAVLLATRDVAEGQAADLLVLQEQIGPVSCAVTVADERSGRAVFTLPRLPEEIDRPGALALLAGALGLEKREIGFVGHEPSIFSAGLGFTFIPVCTLAALRRIRIDSGLWVQAIKPADNAAAFAYCRETDEAGHHYHARMFAPAMGIGEDPATGSAVAAFAGAIMKFDRPGDGEHRFVIEQGYEMERPSQITLELTVAEGALVSARIGGSAIVVSEGVLL